LRRRKEQLLQRTMLIASHFAEIAQFDENWIIQKPKSKSARFIRLVAPSGLEFDGIKQKSRRTILQYSSISFRMEHLIHHCLNPPRHRIVISWLSRSFRPCHCTFGSEFSFR
jgi:hypothetical protein